MTGVVEGTGQVLTGAHSLIGSAHCRDSATAITAPTNTTERPELVRSPAVGTAVFANSACVCAPAAQARELLPREPHQRAQLTGCGGADTVESAHLPHLVKAPTIEPAI